MLEKAKRSPNIPLIRTGNAGKSQKESEYPPHSDRKCWKKPNKVRIIPKRTMMFNTAFKSKNKRCPK
jgi:hypothetical protein